MQFRPRQNTKENHLATKILIRILAALALGMAFAAPTFAEGRLALVLGNSAYAGKALANPANDASDMAKVLGGLGFVVILCVDADYKAMQSALDEFQKRLPGKDTALFYYAGHGVQVQGENFLIPVNTDIQGEADIRLRCVPVTGVLERIRNAGVSTAIVFLDACRDNPFKFGPRDLGSRGLSVVAAPADLETLVAYATEPGSVAADGSGRNGVFTGALLARLAEPGIGILDLMTRVRADVIESTKGAQRPRTDVGLSKPFYFVDPAAMAERAETEKARTAGELAAVEKQLAERQAAIAAAKSEDERRRLEEAQLADQARAAAARIAADSAAKEAAMRLDEARVAKADVEARAADEARVKAERQKLTDLVAQRRKELESLAADPNDLDAQISRIDRLEASLAAIRGQFKAGREAAAADIASRAGATLASLSKTAAKPWETAPERDARVTASGKKLEAGRDAELAESAAAWKRAEGDETAAIAAQLAGSVASLEGRRLVVGAGSVAVTLGAFDRAGKFFPIAIASKVPEFPMDWSLKIDLSASTDISRDYEAILSADKAKALAGEFTYRVDYKAPARYEARLVGARITNISMGATLAERRADIAVAAFDAKTRTAPENVVAKERKRVVGLLSTGQTKLAETITEAKAPIERLRGALPALGFDRVLMEIANPIPIFNFVFGDFRWFMQYINKKEVWNKNDTGYTWGYVIRSLSTTIIGIGAIVQSSADTATKTAGANTMLTGGAVYAIGLALSIYSEVSRPTLAQAQARHDQYVASVAKLEKEIAEARLIWPQLQ